MSVHVEWADAGYVEVELVGPNCDIQGNSVDEGNYAIIFTGDDLMVIEGTKEQLVQLAEAVVAAVSQAPDVALSVVPVGS